MGEKRTAYWMLVGKPGERPLGRHTGRLKNNNKTDCGEKQWGGTD
jgi:hypothetical protein